MVFKSKGFPLGVGWSFWPFRPSNSILPLCLGIQWRGVEKSTKLLWTLKNCCTTSFDFYSIKIKRTSVISGTSMHCADTVPKIRSNYSERMKLRGLVPKISTFMYLWAIYNFPGSVHPIFCCAVSFLEIHNSELLLQCEYSGEKQDKMKVFQPPACRNSL